MISYLTSRPSRDIVIAGHQQTTQDWWQNCRKTFDLVASQLVIREARAGNSLASKQRLAVLKELQLLSVTEEAVSLANTFIETGIMP